MQKTEQKSLKDVLIQRRSGNVPEKQVGCQITVRHAIIFVVLSAIVTSSSSDLCRVESDTERCQRLS